MLHLAKRSARQKSFYGNSYRFVSCPKVSREVSPSGNINRDVIVFHELHNRAVKLRGVKRTIAAEMHHTFTTVGFIFHGWLVCTT
jgi:hypothetical protein